MSTGQGKNKKPPIRKGSEKEEDMFNQSFESKKVVRLEYIVDLDFVPEDNHHEFLYSQLFEDIVILTKHVVSDTSNWRSQESYFANLAS